MGRRPLPAHLRASVSKHVNLHPNEDAWLQEKNICFTDYIRAKIHQDMDDNNDYQKMELIRDFNYHKLKMEETKAIFKSIFSESLDDQLKVATNQQENPERRNYFGLWDYLKQYRSDICKTILGTAYEKEITSDQAIINVISGHLQDKHIIDSPKSALEKLRKYVKEGGWSL